MFGFKKNQPMRLPAKMQVMVTVSESGRTTATTHVQGPTTPLQAKVLWELLNQYSGQEPDDALAELFPNAAVKNEKGESK